MNGCVAGTGAERHGVSRLWLVAVVALATGCAPWGRAATGAGRDRDARTEGEPSTRLDARPGAAGPEGYRLTAVGSDGRWLPFARREVRDEGAGVVVMVHDGGRVVERYVPTTGGVEQTFLVRADPRVGKTFVLRGELAPGVVVRLENGAALLASASGTRVVRVTAPRAFDGHGREIPARFLGGPGRLDVEVRDAHAFPIFVDPAWTSSGDDEVWAGFGYALAFADVDGDGDDDVVVGAVGASVASSVGAGEVYLYEASPAGLSASPVWSASGDQPGTAWDARALGAAIAGGMDVNGDGYEDVAVGAPSYGEPPTILICTAPVCTGAVYLYLGSPTGLAASPAWSSMGDAQPEAQFGFALAAGDVNGDGYDDLIVGANLYDTLPPVQVKSDPAVGKVYLYLGSPAGLSATPAWTSSGDEIDGARYGAALSMGDVTGDGYDDLVVGSQVMDPQGLVPGAYLYEGSPAGLGAVPFWTSAGEGPFAEILALGDFDGDGYDDLASPGWTLSPGGEYVWGMLLYAGSAGGLVAEPVLHDYFGSALSAAGDVNGDGYAELLVGVAPGPGGIGGVSLHLGGTSGLTKTAAWTSEGDAQPVSFFGAAVQIGGDVNGDAYADILVGASRYTTMNADGTTNEHAGKAYLFLGAATPAGVCDPTGTLCDDGDPCTEGEACDSSGRCASGMDICEDAGIPGSTDAGTTGTDSGPPPPGFSVRGGCSCRLSGGDRDASVPTYFILLAALVLARSLRRRTISVVRATS